MRPHVVCLLLLQFGTSIAANLNFRNYAPLFISTDNRFPMLLQNSRLIFLVFMIYNDSYYKVLCSDETIIYKTKETTLSYET